MPDPSKRAVLSDRRTSDAMSDGHWLAQQDRRVADLERLLWECHCAASDGIPVPFERWLAGGGPEAMPADVRDLREAYDTVSEQLHEALNGGSDEA